MDDVPFLGHNPYDGLDVSPDGTPVAQSDDNPVSRARDTVRRFAVDPADESMLLELLGLADADSAV